MGGEVVKEHVAGGLGVLCWGGLIVGDLIKGDDDCRIATAGLIEEEPRDLLNALDASFVKERRRVGGRQLKFFTVNWGGPSVGRMLRASWLGMTQCLQGGVVPTNGESEVAGAGPILGDDILCGKSVEQVISVSFAKKFDTEVVDRKSKCRGTGSVTPKAGGVLDGV